jgi:hypothetical protein
VDVGHFGRKSNIIFFSYNPSSCCGKSEISGSQTNKQWYWLRISIRFCGEVHNEVSNTRQSDITSSRTNASVTSYVQRSGGHFQKNAVKNLLCTDKYVSRDSSVGMATDYFLDGPGSNPGRGLFSAPVQTGSASSYTTVTGSFPGFSGRGVAFATHPQLAPKLMEK